ncbi:hypothetical protein TNIN_323091 [Trichonephila inaurata madagascariensis]|uniref:Uncharacterized protein n=1 Tax=Trichonephila inaurata madagascariensis TaxID=2747483 RepID=A0A8X6YQ61_9ARAC|nr:hypothetical protein TNIN_323091 [Trichonephila inaurata madagascariensis]
MSKEAEINDILKDIAVFLPGKILLSHTALRREWQKKGSSWSGDAVRENELRQRRRGNSQTSINKRKAGGNRETRANFAIS